MCVRRKKSRRRKEGETQGASASTARCDARRMYSWDRACVRSDCEVGSFVRAVG